jgi:tetrahydromethanopterin S-methyltransferase subunit H
VLDIALSDHLDEVSGDPVFNVVNTDTSTSWSNVLDWIQELDDAKFNRVSPSAWIRKLANAKSGTANPSQKLLGLWESKVNILLSLGF